MSDIKLRQVVVYGLGAMGRPMARNLKTQNLLIGVKNRTEGKTQAMMDELDLTEFEDDEALFAAADCVLTCVSADDDLKNVVHDFKDYLKPGAVVIDCSTVSQTRPGPWLMTWPLVVLALLMRRFPVVSRGQKRRTLHHGRR